MYGWVHCQIESTPYERQDDKDILCAPLRKCYEDMLKEFPALNGRDSTDDDELIDKALDYYLAPNVIMVDCGLSQFNAAVSLCMDLARKYGLCIYRIEHITSMDEDTKQINYISRHLIYDCPTLAKAILSSLITPAILFAIILGWYFLMRLIISWQPLPYYMPSIHISPTAITVIAVILCIALFGLEVRNARRGTTKFNDEIRE